MSSSGEEKGHDYKCREHYDVYRSRHGVSACDVLMNGQAAKPQHEGEFRHKQKSKCDNTDAKSFGRQAGAANYPPSVLLLK